MSVGGKCLIILCAFSASAAVPALSAQIAFEQALTELSSPDDGTRLRAVRLLKDAAYPEAAVPLAPLLSDARDEIQFEAIAAELNIFLVDKITTRQRVGFVVEKRRTISAEATFAAGPLAVGGGPVPIGVLSGLRAATRDENGRVALEGLYAFGALAPIGATADRPGLLRASAPELSALLGSPDPALRFGAARVIGRVFAPRPGDPGIDQALGDAVVAAVNDRDRAVKAAAIQALGAMRYDRAVTALTELFTYHARGDQAELSLDALAHIANRASAALFASQLAAKSPALRGIAVEGIARLGEPARLAETQIALKGERADTVLLALAFASTMLTNAAIDPVSEAVARARTKDLARQYLIEIAPGRAGLFARQVQDPDARIRLAAVDALGLSGDPSALTLIQPLTGDSDPAVARAADAALARLTLRR